MITPLHLLRITIAIGIVLQLFLLPNSFAQKDVKIGTGRSELTPEIIRLLKNEPKKGVLMMLTRLREPDLGSGDEQQILNAFIATDSLTIKQSEKGLAELLSNTESGVRLRAVIFLNYVRPLDRETAQKLTNLFEDADPMVQRMAGIALGNATKDVSLVGPKLIAQLGQTNGIVAGGAAAGIGRLGLAAAPLVPTLTNMLASAVSESRTQASQAVSRLHLYPEIFVPLLITNLHHPDVAVRYEALEALRSFGKEAVPATEHIVTCLSDPNSDVRLSAVQTFERLGLPAEKVVEVLNRILTESPGDSVVMVASRMLGGLGKKANGAVPQLERLLAVASSEGAKRELTMALGKIQGKGPMVERNSISPDLIGSEEEKLLQEAKLGSPEAQFKIGEIFRGKGQYSYPKAVEWYQRAADQGYVKAQYELGGAYYMGAGVKKDASIAVKWLSLAADKGHAQAQADLGKIYLDGLQGIAPDPEKGVRLLNQAAYQGDSRACYNLGLAYQNGNGVSPDLIEAYKWFHLGAEAGHPQAKAARAELMNKMDGKDMLEALRRANRYKLPITQ